MNESTHAVETWKPIPGYYGYYQVSDLGRIRSVDRELNCAGGKWTQIVRGRMLKPHIGNHGRRVVSLSSGGTASRHLVYRLVMLAFVGPCPPGLEVCHWDGDRTNDALSNLRYDTRSNNHRDKVRHGTRNESRKECCPRQHPLEAPNLEASTARRGYRKCLACARATANVNHAKRTGREYDFEAWADEHYARIVNEAAA